MAEDCWTKAHFSSEQVSCRVISLCLPVFSHVKTIQNLTQYIVERLSDNIKGMPNIKIVLLLKLCWGQQFAKYWEWLV